MDPLEALPHHVLAYATSFLDAPSVLSLCEMSSAWLHFASSPAVLAKLPISSLPMRVRLGQSVADLRNGASIVPRAFVERMARAGNLDANLALGLSLLSDDTTPVKLDHAALYKLIPSEQDSENPEHATAADYFKMATRAGSQIAAFAQVQMGHHDLTLNAMLSMLYSNAMPQGNGPECSLALQLYGWFVPPPLLTIACIPCLITTFMRAVSF
jgi:hypothetical protein